MEPIDTRQSMLDEPSSGSKHTMYFPCFSVSTWKSKKESKRNWVDAINERKVVRQVRLHIKTRDTILDRSPHSITHEE